ncbi:hypothetical protein NUW58_g10134 [Xylaria curta]|uniref:Uncharacterized protein n=1 Tax=Xylaria curta TaxID=42375 RepID=A0ACC1MQ66_9PEZI|nr:hypothetical protein NUW58_g10134 [Xylaria curta]
MIPKRLEAAESKLAATRAVSDPEATDEEGLPITEISEELDDDDNVISYSLRRPGDNQPQLLQALERAGIKELPSGSHEPVSFIASDTQKSAATVPSSHVDTKEQSQSIGENTAEASQARKTQKKKSVTFTEDTKEADEEKPSSTVQRLEELYRQARNQENLISDPVMPADESPEDAALREDMILYNKETMMYEMAPIVAELKLEEESSDDDDWNYDDDDEDDEDEWGRSTSGVVDDEYRRQMLELKERLSKQTFGEEKALNEDEDDEYSEGIGRITVRHERPASAQSGSDSPAAKGDVADSTSKNEAKKSVRFAPNLDIAEPSPPAAQLEPPSAQHSEVEPFSDIVERNPLGANKTTATSGRKVSKFRKERINGDSTTEATPIIPEKPTDHTRYAPSGPEGQTLASTVLEHKPSGEIKEPDELDANLLHQQVTEEYYKMRNKMIGRQGGFLKENTDAIQPLEEEEGGPKRVSRFKAARLAKS